ncbi:Dynamin central region-domain-containing protein [Aspergillus foveolatus]|uniref:Dynamin central region-domain-containing protein n=1 Tax=Aspergillus foveolatus TaxID=210207 RepID=UPI003CCDC0CE
MPCNVDIATQEILKLAEEADPSGIRTMGVLTKPDLATEKVTQDAAMDLLLERRNVLKLGYHVVKNRSADDDNSTLPGRLADERAFFAAPPWSRIPDRCGITSLQTRLRELLMFISRKELGPVKLEIEERLRKRRAELEIMGPARDDSNAQRQYLGKLATQFQTTTQSALNGYYAGDDMFNQSEPNLKLITKVVKLNEVFSDIFWKRGHKQYFGATWDDEGEASYGSSTENSPFQIPLREYPELYGIVQTDDYICPKPLKGPIMSLIEEVFESSRGPELGTKKRSERMCKSLETLAVSFTDGEGYVPVKALRQRFTTDKDNRQQVCEDILDTLMSYYKVARKRFVDIVCQQVIHHFLLETDDGPLRIFSPDLVMSLSTEQLEMVAGEDAESKRRRNMLKQEIDSLEAALRILRF